MGSDLLSRHAVLRLVVSLAAIIAVLYTGGLIWSALIHFGGIILLLFLAWVVAFILYPPTLALERRGLPRLAAIALIYTVAAALVAGLIVLSIPIIRSQIQHFAGQLTVTFTPSNINHLEAMAVKWLERVGLRPADARGIVGQATGRLPGLATTLSAQAGNIAQQLFSLIGTLVFDVVLVAILSFYMMLDGDQLLERWILKLPPSWLPDIRLFQYHIETIFGGFLRAQLIISGAYGLLTGLIMAAVGMWQVALLVGILAAVLMLIPLVGPIVSVVPPVLLVLLESPPDVLIRNLLIVLIGMMVGQHIILNLLAPKIMGDHVGLHPLLLFVALLVGAQEGGAWGAVFAGPIAAILVAMLDVFFVRFQQASSFYPHVEEPAAGTDDLEDDDRPSDRESNGERAEKHARKAVAADRRARREAKQEIEAEEETAKAAASATQEKRQAERQHADGNETSEPDSAAGRPHWWDELVAR
jgi:predicted PurR-regulated permease PerM